MHPGLQFTMVAVRRRERRVHRPVGARGFLTGYLVRRRWRVRDRVSYLRRLCGQVVTAAAGAARKGC